MENRLLAVKEILTNRLGEEAIGKKIAGYVRDLFVVESIQRIQGATTAAPVWEDLEEYGVFERVCEAALERLWTIAQQINSDHQRRFGVGDVIRDAFSEGSVDTILLCMTQNPENESIQVNGPHVLREFANYVPNSEALTTSRCIEALCSAMANFPGSTQVHSSVLSSVFPIQQFSIWKQSLNELYTNLIAAGALNLSLAALERHVQDYQSVLGALCVFANAGNETYNVKTDRMDTSNRRTFLSFVQAHPNIRERIEHAVAIQEQLHPNDIYVRREAFMALSAMELV